MDIPFHLTMLNFIAYVSILRSFCSHSSLALSNLCCHLTSQPNLSIFCKYIKFNKFKHRPFAELPPVGSLHSKNWPFILMLFLTFYFILSVLSPMWQLNFLKNLSEIFVGCVDQDLPFPHPSWFLQRTPRDLQVKNIMAFTEAMPSLTRANCIYLGIH